MEISLSIEELRKRKLFVSTPMYGGMCTGIFAKSMCDLTTVGCNYQLSFKYHNIYNESLITRARNYCVDEFMRDEEFTHFLFIDSDIGFNAEDVIAMLAMMSDDSPYDILCAPYPKKCIAWEKVKRAVDKGMADKDPNILEKFVGDYVFNAVGNQATIPLSEPVEVMEAGTGFMMIRRSAFEKYKEAYPELMYKPDHVRTKHFDGSREIMCYFDAVIDPESKRYLSEDYMFCQNARKAGLKVWLCPWMNLQHAGFMIFGGSLGDLAAIGATATADESVLGSKK